MQQRDYDAKFSKKLDEVIYHTKVLHTPVTAAEIFAAFSKEDQKLFTTQKINDYLRKEPRSLDVIKLKKKRDGLTQYVLREYWKEDDVSEYDSDTSGSADIAAEES